LEILTVSKAISSSNIPDSLTCCIQSTDIFDAFEVEEKVKEQGTFQRWVDRVCLLRRITLRQGWIHFRHQQRTMFFITPQ
jgi:SAM-dependent MidA family methyltransferase